MKPLLLILYLFFGVTTYAQTYKFDLIATYTQKVSGRERTRIVCSNATNDHYFLTIGTFTSSSTAFLSDFKKQIYHTYEIVETNMNYTFKHLSTSKIESTKAYLNHEFVFEEIESDSLFRKVKVLIYKNAKRKRPVTSRTVVLEKSDHDLFSLYRVACLHPWEKLDKMKYPGKYKVVSGKGKTSGGYKIETKLVSIKPINLIMNIPRE
ncbi:hypothetical protein FORMB_18270 [Formosa sp. Hel1_33_131]|jgi:hypothetical protein|uniref:hypothetical protein n=1 Tax=Formosa sp. Hel1_33_131 TaxID=1336794 RepID=UPI00084E1626|nr:hypothetical protein [Formosa sp. Hel1_33_131]AOR28859.1 hypothetical protein FORMB_18270 [Formosa sp. Hel1_33_131]